MFAFFVTSADASNDWLLLVLSDPVFLQIFCVLKDFINCFAQDVTNYSFAGGCLKFSETWDSFGPVTGKLIAAFI